MTRQLEFDWTRAEQLGMLERSVLPRRPGVSPAAMKAVLRAIDGFGRGREAWPSEITIGTAAGLTDRTVRRALRALVDLSLLCIDRRGALTLNHYRIVWSELSVLCPENRTERPDMVSERPDMVSERPDMVSAEPSEETSEETTTPAGRTANGSGVVVFLQELEAAGLIDPGRTLRMARQHALDDAAIAERLQAWRLLPAAGRLPGILHNWLAKPNSYRATQQSTDPPKLQLRELPSDADNRRRAMLIRHGRRSGWSHVVLQEAVRRLEEELLARPVAERLSAP